MENTTKSINSLISAFETRNELLHEEIKRNEEAIKKMEKELILIEEQDVEKEENNQQNDSTVEMVA